MFFNTLLSITLAVLGNFLVAGALDGRLWWLFVTLAILSGAGRVPAAV